MTRATPFSSRRAQRMSKISALAILMTSKDIHKAYLELPLSDS